MTEDDALKDEQEAIAIIGMAGRMPGAADLDAFWRNLRDGVDSISTFTEAELLAEGVDSALLRHPDFVAARGVLADIDLFDAAFFGLAPSEAELVDPQHRLLMECAWEAMEDAGYDAETFDGRISVFTSTGMNTYLPLHILSHDGLAEQAGGFQLSIFNDKDFVPTRIAYALNATGPGVDIGTACSSSLVTLHFACQSLLTYQSDMVLVGAVTVHLPQKTGLIHETGSPYSPDGRCRPFDATPSGLVDGNGMASIVLKRLEDALADGDTIHAVVKGTAINNDGSVKLGYTAPSIDGQAAVIREAQAAAGCAPDTISYIEAHGTATPLGDPVEVAALTQAFRAGTSRTGFCGLGAVKSNIGHVDKAAGLAGLIKTVLALRHGMIPPTLHYTAPNPKLNLPETPFHVIDRLTPWPRTEGAPRRAGISSFGVGGTNAHAIIEEAPLPQPGSPSRPIQVIALSAKSEAALQEAAARLAGHLDANPDIDLADLCHTLHRGRRAFAYRRAFACHSASEAATRLRDPLPGRYCERGDRAVAFLFPGQGSQYPGMAASLYRTEPDFRDQLDQCAGLLEADLGQDIRDLLFPAPEATERAADRLRQTAIAQPALFAVEYALARLLMGWGLVPQAMIGHSLGEYVAACLAGVFSLEDGLALVAARGRLMQALPPGDMLAVSLGEADLIARLTDGLDLAAVNAPDLCVVSGPPEAVAAFKARLDGDGVPCRPLHTSHAFHSAMMAPILDEIAALVGRIALHPPRIPYLSNLTGAWITAEEANRPAYWADHLRRPVRFADGLAALGESGAGLLLEVGPGRTLSGLAARAEGGAEMPCFPTLPQARDTAAADAVLMQSLADLWQRGAAMDWAGFWRHERRRRVSLPPYPFQRRSYWIAPLRRGAAQTAGPAGRRSDIADWFHLPGWKATVFPPSSPVAEGDSTLLFLDEHGLGESLADALRRNGHRVVTARPGDGFAQMTETAFTLDPTRRDDFSALCDALFVTGGLPRRILFLWGYGDGGDGPAGRIGRHAGPALSLVQALAWLALEAPVALTVIADGMVDVSGETRLDPAKAALLGLVATIPWEHTDIVCRAIDVPSPSHIDVPSPDHGEPADRLARRLIREITAPDCERVVALRGGRRWVQTPSPVRLEAGGGEAALPAGGVWVVTGGSGAIGGCLARTLAGLAPVKLALLDTAPPPPDAEALAVRLESWDADRLETALADIEARLGPITGLIHAAGMDEDRPVRPIRDLDEAILDRYWRRQENILTALDTCLDRRPAASRMVMSSLAADLGGIGLAAHAVAAAWTDAFALRRSWTVVDWDPWTEEASDAAPWAMTGADGAEAFRRLLRLAPESRILVATGDPASRRAAPRAGAGPTERQADGHRRPDLPVAHMAPRSEEEAVVAGLWQEVLGIDGIGIHDNFFDLGGHSLLAAQLASRLRQTFRAELDLDSIFAAPTIAEITAMLVAGRSDDGAEEDLAQLLDRLETMSEAEVAALLASGELPAELLGDDGP